MEKRTTKLALILLFLFQIAEANVLINEICWMGDSSSSSNEWIELYNDSDKDISLDGWQIIISDNKIVNLKGVVPSKEFYLLSRNKNQKQADLFYSKALNNKGEKIELIDNNKIIVDTIDFLSGWPYGNNETKQTMEKTSEEWQTSLNQEGTPKEKNSLIEKEKEKIVNHVPEKSNNNNTIVFSLLFSLCSGGVIVFTKKLL